MAEQEHRITYKAGITRTPSDFLCADGELAECINLATDSEELKPMVQPAAYITSAVNGSGVGIDMPKILYIHKYNGQEMYIGLRETDNGVTVRYDVVWGLGDKENMRIVFPSHNNLLPDSTEKVRVTSIGKSLTVADPKGIHYYMWNADEGKYDTKGLLETPKIRFWLQDSAFKSNTGSYGSILDLSQQTDSKKIIEQEEYNDLIVGLYDKTKKSIAQSKRFCNPFLALCALELYDGTYTKITNPVMLFPCVTSNSHVTAVTLSGDKNLQVSICGYELYFSLDSDYSGFSDIVKNVVIFVSSPTDIYDLSVDQEIHRLASGAVIRDTVCRLTNDPYSKYRTYDNTGLQVGFDAIKKKDTKEVIDNLKSTSVFRKLCEIGIKPVSSGRVSEKIQTHTLENLDTQDRLDTIDYFSHTQLIPEFIYAYNSRLNIANVSRGFFEGFHHFLPLDSTFESYYYFYVKIKTDSGTVWVKHKGETAEKQGLYFYYPDPRATHVTIYKKEPIQQDVYNFYCVLDADLKEHPGLNGAYYYDGTVLPSEYGESQVQVGSEGYSTTIDRVDEDDADNGASEQLANYVIQSEVNNPWVFTAGGYNKVSTGKIVGMSTTTMALSQDQFGRTDLIVFSENGIWGMQVDGTGMYESIHPITRDVCINPENITQTDFAVFFVTKKGLMVISQDSVRCVSAQMNGVTFDTATLSPLAADTDWAGIVSACQGTRSFLDYIRDGKCVLAYDYIDSRVLIINPDFGFAFVYSMADGTISKAVLPATVTNTVNNYPDYLLQSGHTLYSLYDKPREEEVTARQTAFLLTRPMKLAGPVSQSSLRQLMNVGMWSAGSVVKTEVYLSGDMRTWYNDKSRFGAAARYYRLALFIKMRPTERLSGTILTDQERRGNHMR